MIKIENLSKFFGENKVLDNINTRFEKGSVTTILGPSGSGKSTLIRCINMLENISSGNIYVDNIEVCQKNIKSIRNITGMIFQNFNLFPHMNVMENITYSLIKVQNKSIEESNSHALELLKKVGLENKAYSYPSSLSGGEKQRVAIVRALALNPSVLLCDEPTSALDPENVKEVLNVIKSYAHTNITIIMVTHEIMFAKQVADKILFLDQGKILEETRPEQFFKKPQTERASIFLNNIL